VLIRVNSWLSLALSFEAVNLSNKLKRVLLSPDQTRQNKHLPAFCIRVADSPPDRSTGPAGKCEIKEQTNKQIN
jgi:hypothetical protein